MKYENPKTNIEPDFKSPAIKPSTPVAELPYITAVVCPSSPYITQAESESSVFIDARKTVDVKAYVDPIVDPMVLGNDIFNMPSETVD